MIPTPNHPECAKNKIKNLTLEAYSFIFAQTWNTYTLSECNAKKLWTVAQCTILWRDRGKATHQSWISIFQWLALHGMNINWVWLDALAVCRIDCGRCGTCSAVRTSRTVECVIRQISQIPSEIVSSIRARRWEDFIKCTFGMVCSVIGFALNEGF